MPSRSAGGGARWDPEPVERLAEHHQTLDVDHGSAPEGLQPGPLESVVAAPAAALVVPVSLLPLDPRPLSHQRREVRLSAPFSCSLELVFVGVDADRPSLAG